ncbi:MAG TPA: GNAT family N-acetyltransferase [Stellaceae bacterium]|jgi:ribosomal protein S18 acetylase RimI-like enzyme|nr:GNAT family N-acetyltransferase [Stellaceae bacterium]
METIATRLAHLDDAAGIARLDVETWQAAYAGILETAYLVGLSAERRERGWANAIRREPRDVRVATTPDGAIVGFGSCGRCRDEKGYTGEVFTLYVAPDWQNQGIGRALLVALFARLIELNHQSAVVWVLSDNPARFFYQRLGGREVRRRNLPVGGAQIAATGFGWPDLPQYLSALARGAHQPEP